MELATSIPAASWSKLREYKARGLVYVVLFCALIAAFILSLAASLTLVDDKAIEARLRQSLASGVFNAAEYPVSPYGDNGHRYDMFSECVAFSIGHGESDRNVFSRLIASNFVAEPGTITRTNYRACLALKTALDSGDLKANANYFRFWHGYQVYMRPMLAHLGLDGMRSANLLILYGAILFFAFSLAPLVGGWGVAWIVAALALTGDYFTMPLVTVHALPTAWIFFSVGLTARMLAAAPPIREAVPLFVFAAGAVANFLSFLFNPPLAPTLIAFVALAHAAWRGEGVGWRTQARALGLAFIWFAGFFLAWLAKWALAAIVLGQDFVLQDVIVSASGAHYAASLDAKAHLLLGPTLALLFEPNAGIFRIFLPAAVISAILLYARKIRSGGAAPSLVQWIALQSPILIAIAWVEKFAIHSLEHRLLTVRDFEPLVLFPPLAMLVLLRRAEHEAVAPREHFGREAEEATIN